MLRYSLCNRSSETFATTLNNSPQSLPSWDAALKITQDPSLVSFPSWETTLKETPT